MFKRLSRSTAKKTAENTGETAPEKSAAKADKKVAKADKLAAKAEKKAAAKADKKKAVAKTTVTAQSQIYRKPKSDIYTLMLSIALIVIVLSTVVLWMVMKNYDYKINGGPNPVWHRPAAPATFDPPREVA